MAPGTLLERFLQKENFLSAYKRLSEKSAVGGLDGISVKAFGAHLDQNILRLQKEIRERRYVPQPAQVVSVPKFNEKNETRDLGLPCVADKLVQTALLQIVEPVAERLFLNTSYGYRPGKGPQKALRRVEHNLRCGKRLWAVRRDIDNFFETINHDMLLDAFSRLVEGDPVLVELVALWCKIGLVDRNGRWKNVMAGVRQGHVISPLLANLYLHPLDLFIAESEITSVRYADDILLQCLSEGESVSADRTVQAFLKKQLGLEVNEDEGAISNVDKGFTFLGVRFHGTNRSIDGVKLEKMQRKVVFVLSPRSNGEPGAVLEKLHQMADGWVRYYGFLGPDAGFSQIDKVMADCLCELVTDRIKKGLWSSVLPEGLTLPLLTRKADPLAARQALEAIWRKAVSASAVGDIQHIKAAVHKKIHKREWRHRKEQNVRGELVVTTPGFFIVKRGERVIVRNKQEIVAEVPSLHLTGLTVACHGVALSTDVIGMCVAHNVPVHLMDESGRIYALLTNPHDLQRENVLAQLREQDTLTGMVLAKQFVLGKVKNQFALLKYYKKYGAAGRAPFLEALEEKSGQIEQAIHTIRTMPLTGHAPLFRQTLMGLEGKAASVYWSLVKILLTGKTGFPGRVREGACDIVNSSLNYGYGILYSRALNALVRAKLNPSVGFLHSPQPGKPVLVYDIVEEFRPAVVDRTIFTMMNRGEALKLEESGLLTPDTRRKIARSVMERLASKIAWCGQTYALEEVIQAQAHSVVHHLRGEARYRPFLVKW